MAEQLRIAAPDGSEARITISIGVVEWQPGEDFASMLRRADDHLYAAKAAGRNTVRSH
jgi:diguanylate cyclase (GGDEF)-like protein